MHKLLSVGIFAATACLLTGCVQTVTSTVGAAANAGVGAAKAGVSVAGTAVDVATPDGDTRHESKDKHKDHHDNDPRPFDATANATMDVDIALAAARVSDRNVLLVLGGNWCHDSRGLAAKFQQPELADVIAEYYELVWVDVGYRDRNLHVPRRFGVDELYGTPTVLILSPEGELLNADTVHEWRTADSKPYDETLAYFEEYAGVS